MVFAPEPIPFTRANRASSSSQTAVDAGSKRRPSCRKPESPPSTDLCGGSNDPSASNGPAAIRIGARGARALARRRGWRNRERARLSWRRATSSILLRAPGTFPAVRSQPDRRVRMWSFPLGEAGYRWLHHRAPEQNPAQDQRGRGLPSCRMPLLLWRWPWGGSPNYLLRDAASTVRAEPRTRLVVAPNPVRGTHADLSADDRPNRADAYCGLGLQLPQARSPSLPLLTTNVLIWSWPRRELFPSRRSRGRSWRSPQQREFARRAGLSGVDMTSAPMRGSARERGDHRAKCPLGTARWPTTPSCRSGTRRTFRIGAVAQLAPTRLPTNDDSNHPVF